MKKIQIADWDSPGQVIEVDDDSTVASAFEKAQRALGISETVKSMNSNITMSPSDIVEDGATYIVARSHVSG